MENNFNNCIISSQDIISRCFTISLDPKQTIELEFNFLNTFASANYSGIKVRKLRSKFVSIIFIDEFYLINRNPKLFDKI
jgi:hypothetical protein